MVEHLLDSLVVPRASVQNYTMWGYMAFAKKCQELLLALLGVRPEMLTPALECRYLDRWDSEQTVTVKGCPVFIDLYVAAVFAHCDYSAEVLPPLQRGLHGVLNSECNLRAITAMGHLAAAEPLLAPFVLDILLANKSRWKYDLQAYGQAFVSLLQASPGCAHQLRPVLESLMLSSADPSDGGAWYKQSVTHATVHALIGLDDEFPSAAASAQLLPMLAAE
jgi:hypothetical protein